MGVHDNEGKWFPLFYDLDTILGINNEGTLEFTPYQEWGDVKTSGGNVYNGQNQLLWELILATYGDEIKQMYKDMRAGNVKPEIMNALYDDFQKKFGERLYNEDAEFSYIDPYLELGDETYFEMCQGMKTSQRHYFLNNRFDYLDSKFNAGNSLANACTVRGYASNNLSVKYNMPIYASIKYGSQLVQSRVLTPNTETTLPIPSGMSINDTETYIYSCDRLTAINGLAGYQIGYADFSKAINLKDLNIGDHSNQSYTNTHFQTLRLGNNKLLEKLDCAGCTNLAGNIDLSQCTNLDTVYFDRTKITGLTLPNTGTVNHVVIPNTVKQLTIKNQTINDFNWNSGSSAFDVLDQCTIENSTLKYQGLDIDISGALVDGEFHDNAYVRFIGIELSCDTGAEAQAMATNINRLKGIDENGSLVDTAQISGDLYITNGISQSTYNALHTAMPLLTIHATILPSILLSVTTNILDVSTTPATISSTSTTSYELTSYATGHVLTSEDIATTKLQALLVCPTGNSVTEEGTKLYKRQCTANYGTLFDSLVGTTVTTDITKTATVNKVESTLSVSFTYMPQSKSTLQFLVTRTTLETAKTYTVDTVAFANHTNLDDPTEVVSKPTAFSFTNQTAKDYSSSPSSITLATLTKEQLYNQYVTSSFDMVDTYVDPYIYVIYNEVILVTLYGCNITQDPGWTTCAEILGQLSGTEQTFKDNIVDCLVLSNSYSPSWACYTNGLNTENYSYYISLFDDCETISTNGIVWANYPKHLTPFGKTSSDVTANTSTQGSIAYFPVKEVATGDIKIVAAVRIASWNTTSNNYNHAVAAFGIQHWLKDNPEYVPHNIMMPFEYQIGGTGFNGGNYMNMFKDDKETSTWVTCGGITYDISNYSAFKPRYKLAQSLYWGFTMTYGLFSSPTSSTSSTWQLLTDTSIVKQYAWNTFTYAFKSQSSASKQSWTKAHTYLTTYANVGQAFTTINNLNYLTLKKPWQADFQDYEIEIFDDLTDWEFVDGDGVVLSIEDRLATTSQKMMPCRYYNLTGTSYTNTDCFMGFGKGSLAANSSSSASYNAPVGALCVTANFALVNHNTHEVLYQKNGYKTYDYEEDMPTYDEAVPVDFYITRYVENMHYINNDSSVSQLPYQVFLNFCNLDEKFNIEYGISNADNCFTKDVSAKYQNDYMAVERIFEGIEGNYEKNTTLKVSCGSTSSSYYSTTLTMYRGDGTDFRGMQALNDASYAYPLNFNQTSYSMMPPSHVYIEVYDNTGAIVETLDVTDCLYVKDYQFLNETQNYYGAFFPYKQYYQTNMYYGLDNTNGRLDVYTKASSRSFTQPTTRQECWCADKTMFTPVSDTSYSKTFIDLSAVAEKYPTSEFVSTNISIDTTNHYVQFRGTAYLRWGMYFKWQDYGKVARITSYPTVSSSTFIAWANQFTNTNTTTTYCGGHDNYSSVLITTNDSTDSTHIERYNAYINGTASRTHTSSALGDRFPQTYLTWKNSKGLFGLVCPKAYRHDVSVHFSETEKSCGVTFQFKNTVNGVEETGIAKVIFYARDSVDTDLFVHKTSSSYGTAEEVTRFPRYRSIFLNYSHLIDFWSTDATNNRILARGVLIPRSRVDNGTLAHYSENLDYKLWEDMLAHRTTENEATCTLTGYYITTSGSEVETTYNTFANMFLGKVIS